MQFVPYQTLSDPITVKVSAHASDNSPTFSEAVTLQLMESQRPRTTANVTWTCRVLDGRDSRDKDRRGENRHRRTGEGHRHLLGFRLLGEALDSGEPNRSTSAPSTTPNPRRLQRAHRRAPGETAGGGRRSDNVLQHALCPVDGCRPKIFFQTEGEVRTRLNAEV